MPQVLLSLLYGLFAHVGEGTGAEASSQPLAEEHLVRRLGMEEMLGVRVGAV